MTHILDDLGWRRDVERPGRCPCDTRVVETEESPWMSVRLQSWIGIVALVAVCMMAVLLIGPVLSFGSWGSEPAKPVTFDRDRQALDQIAAFVRSTGDTSYYGPELPEDLAEFSATESASLWGDMVFVPQWTAIPDDAGGYIHSPGRSPEGVDMYGMQCRDPVPLDGGWWTCGM